MFVLSSCCFGTLLYYDYVKTSVMTPQENVYYNGATQFPSGSVAPLLVANEDYDTPTTAPSNSTSRTSQSSISNQVQQVN